jgi:hypothetical protein
MFSYLNKSFRRSIFNEYMYQTGVKDTDIYAKILYKFEQRCVQIYLGSIETPKQTEGELCQVGACPESSRMHSFNMIVQYADTASQARTCMARSTTSCASSLTPPQGSPHKGKDIIKDCIFLPHQVAYMHAEWSLISAD